MNINETYEPLRHQIYYPMKDRGLKKLEDEMTAYARANRISDSKASQIVMDQYVAREAPGVSYETLLMYDHFNERIHKLNVYWNHFGKAIYDCSALAEMFARTSAEEIPVDELDMPFDTIYVHFGPSAGLTMTDGRHIEGCYVKNAPQPNEDNVKLVIAFHANYADLENHANDSLPIATIKSSCCAFVVLENGAPIGRLDYTGESLDGDPAITQDTPLINRAVAILANFLLYLELDDADIAPEYPPDTPENLAVKAPKNPKVRRKLSEMGYSLVRFVGRKFVAACHREDGDPSAGITAHWRQGHWHHVRTGVGRVNRVRRWYRPIRVGDPHNDTKPRVYLLPQEDAIDPP